MRIGILTFHRAYNCGAMLQAWALKTVLERMGHEVAFPNCNAVGEDARFVRFKSSRSGVRFLVDFARYAMKTILSFGALDFQRRQFKRFRTRHFKMIESGRNELGKRFDLLVFGSDQIWNYYLAKQDSSPEGGVPLFWGEIDGVRKIAYAASRGEFVLSQEQQERLTRATRKFEAIGVRELSSGAGLQDRQCRGAAVVPDPTLLLQAEEYYRLADRRRLKKGNYILVYTLWATPFVCNLAEEASRALKLDVVILAMYQYGRYKCPKHVRIAFGPKEWLAYLRDAEAVLSSSFHGTVFSVLFGKPFVSIRDADDVGETRQQVFLAELGEEKRYVSHQVKPCDWTCQLQRKPSDLCAQKICEMRNHGLMWLREALSEC